MLSAVAVASSYGVIAQTVPSSRMQYMASGDLRPGMKGYGLTVFQGTVPERFDVEIVDVLHNYRPGTDMIIIRPSHPQLTIAGSVAGMSGSPIYIDGKLIGAYAWGWEFGNTTVAGVTPINAMIEELQRSRRTPAGVLPGSQLPLPVGPNAGGILGRTMPRAAMTDAMDDSVDERSWLPGASRRAAGIRDESSAMFSAMKPLAVPFAIGGASEGAMRYIAETLEPYGMLPMQAGGGSGSGMPIPPGSPTHFVPGGSVTIGLITGDIVGGGNGTITHVEGDRVLGFGHPMFGMGEVLLPAALARVGLVFTSVRSSRKMSEPIADLGALIEDRSSTIILDESAKPLTFPIHVKVNGAPRAPKTEWNTRAAYLRPLVTRLAVMTYVSAVETAAGEQTDLAWSVHTKINVRDHGAIEFDDKGFAADGTSGMVGMFGLGSMNAFDALERLNENVFTPVVIEGIDIEVNLNWSRDFYYLRSLAASRSEVDPGDTVQVIMQLGQYGNVPPVVKSVPVVIPRELAGKEVEIELASGSDVLRDMPEPENVEGLVRNLKTGTYPEDAVVLSLRTPGVGVTMRGRVIPNLPVSALDALRTGNPIGSYQRTVVPMGRVVLGRDRVKIRVRDTHP